MATASLLRDPVSPHEEFVSVCSLRFTVYYETVCFRSFYRDMKGTFGVIYHQCTGVSVTAVQAFGHQGATRSSKLTPSSEKKCLKDEKLTDTKTLIKDFQIFY